MGNEDTTSNIRRDCGEDVDGDGEHVSTLQTTGRGQESVRGWRLYRMRKETETKAERDTKAGLASETRSCAADPWTKAAWHASVLELVFYSNGETRQARIGGEMMCGIK